MAVGDGAHGKHDPHFPIEQIFKTPAERALLTTSAVMAKDLPARLNDVAAYFPDGAVERLTIIAAINEIESMRRAYHPDLTIQSEMRRAGKEIADLNIEIERLKAIIVADTHVLLSKRPVAWRVYSGASYWRVFTDEAKANEVADLGGVVVQGLYARDGK